MEAGSSSGTTTRIWKTYGHIPGVPVYTPFKSRDALLKAGVHGHLQEGIAGDPSPDGGAYSIVISGGYKDDKDMGDNIIYAGSGGRDKSTETPRQIEDQSFEHPPNQSLLVSSQTKRPVRVIRGANNHSHYAPETGYRYDGLYIVDSAELKEGKDRYKVCFFTLRRMMELGNNSSLPTRRLISERGLRRMLRNAPPA